MAVAAYPATLHHGFGAPCTSHLRTPPTLNIYPTLVHNSAATLYPVVADLVSTASSAYKRPAGYNLLRDAPALKSVDPLTNDQHLTLMADLVSRTALYLWYDRFFTGKTLSTFNKFVFQMLKSTSLSSSVILLSLRYIHRFRCCLVAREVRRESEFRIFTVAVMLASKFLEDNTFTTKTWAEVSGIDFAELHKIQVEFLTTLKHDLYVDGAEYCLWLRQLARFVCREHAEFSYPRAAINTLTAFSFESPVDPDCLPDESQENLLSPNAVHRKRPHDAVTTAIPPTPAAAPLADLSAQLLTPNPSPYMGHVNPSSAYYLHMPTAQPIVARPSKRPCLRTITGIDYAVPAPPLHTPPQQNAYSSSPAYLEVNRSAAYPTPSTQYHQGQLYPSSSICSSGVPSPVASSYPYYHHRQHHHHQASPAYHHQQQPAYTAYASPHTYQMSQPVPSQVTPTTSSYSDFTTPAASYSTALAAATHAMTKLAPVDDCSRSASYFGQVYYNFDHGTSAANTSAADYYNPAAATHRAPEAAYPSHGANSTGFYSHNAATQTYWGVGYNN